MADLRFCAQFPFSEEARAHVRERQLALTPQALADGAARLKEGLSSGEIKSAVTDLSSAHLQQLMAYAASRYLLAAWGNRWAQRRMAVAESKRAHDYLRAEDNRGQAISVGRGDFQKLAREFGMEFSPTGAEGSKESFSLPFWQFLPNAPRDVHYKLATLSPRAGRVTLTLHQAMRLVEEAIRHRLEEPLASVGEAEPELKALLAPLEALIPRENLAPSHIDQQDFPPCILKLLSDLAHSVNVPHLGRVALAVYLIKAGLSDEQIGALFSTAPDYNADTTKYQVEYARKKGYSMASCATMDSWGLCIANCRCFNPLKFKRAVHGKFADASVSQTAHADAEKTPAAPAIADPHASAKKEKSAPDEKSAGPSAPEKEGRAPRENPSARPAASRPAPAHSKPPSSA